MAGASSSSGGSFKYDVFINFRGEDTRKSFICHLYEALKQKALETFIDSEELRKGDDLSELPKAIQDSRLSIVVFSKDYASSTWCLKELVQIMECVDRQRHIVVPIFYEIDPSHVRKLREGFAEAFAKHENDSNIDNQELERWKSCLTRATNLSGYDSRIYQNDIPLIKSIVEDVLKKLNRNAPRIPDGLIGMDAHMAKLDSLLELGANDCRIVGIWGMGGIGKSTIATAVYEKISPQFDHKCFLDKVKEDFTKNGARHMVAELLSKILKIDPSTLDGGLEIMRERLSKIKVLIVLDDVDDAYQFETLIGRRPSFGGGSRIIITTRDKTLLPDRHYLYKPKLFNTEKALELFDWYAFRSDKHSEAYDQISKRAVEYAQGLPLALRVLGCLLYNIDVKDWDYELDKIKKIPMTAIGQVLKASYDGLDELQKNIFLDIACFFRGKSENHVIEFHESCGFSPRNGLRVLKERSLVTVSNVGKLEMHDLIQETGKDIVRQESIEKPKRRSRLWHQEDVVEVLAQNKGAEAVQGIILDLSNLDDVFVNNEAFVGMKRLRMLQLEDGKHFYYQDTLRGECKQHMSGDIKFLPNELRVLIWYRCPQKSLPSNFSPKNLIKLKMQRSHIKQLWKGSKSLQNLVKMDLRYSKDLIRTPDFREAKKLKWLYLTGCTSLLEVDPSILALESLVELNLSGCTNLERFPSTSGNMKAIPKLSTNDLPGLVILILSGCRELISLPSSIHMKSLSELYLDGCSKLEKFPEISGEMESLWLLRLDGTAIKELPSSINHLTGLSDLSMRNCTSLVCLPEEICNLTCLYYLNLIGCSKVEKLPENLANSMSSMDEDHCKLVLDGSGIKQLPFGILGIFEVSCKGCREITAPFSSWPTWNHQTSSDTVLSKLDLRGCNLLEVSDAIAHISSLEDLNLSGNDKLESLPAAMNRLGCLKELRLEGCKRLKSIPELSPSIKFIYANNCTSLVTVSTPQLPCAKACGLFQFFNCSKLVNTNLFIDIVESVIDNQESLEVNDHEYGYHCMDLPGSDIPDWFDHQSRGSSVTVQLPPDGFANKFQGFAVCAISNLRGAGNREILQSALCCATFKTTVGQTRFDFCLFPDPYRRLERDTPLESDHMFLGCYHSISSDSGEYEAISECTEAIQFKIVDDMGIMDPDSYDSICTWITSFGVRLFYGSKAPSSVDICNSENRETETERNKRTGETQERGKEKKKKKS